MPSTKTLRLTLVNNAKQTQRSAVLLKVDKPSDAMADILTLARNKLRLKKAKALYLTQGVEIMDGSWFVDGRITQDSLVFVSCGEMYIGQMTAPASVPPSLADTIPTSSRQQEDGSMATAMESSLTFKDSTGEEDNTPMSATATPSQITVLAKKSYVDPEAETQLKRVALLPGMRRVVGQPDLHPGQATPVGATFITENIIYPSLIGNDIGCGMAVYKTRLSSTIRPQKIVDRLVQLEGPWSEGDPHQFLKDQVGPADLGDAAAKIYLDQLGTLGGGNHFAEFVVVETLVDADLCASFDITDDKTYLIVHTGSRKFGQAVLEATRASKSDKKAVGIEADSVAGRVYLAQHHLACQWARANRELVAHRVLTRLNAEQDAHKILDIWHNNVERKDIAATATAEGSSSTDKTEQQQHCWIHRKGAAPSDRGLVVIPGSRGHHSYLVLPQGDQTVNGFSLAHGAGRLLPRAKALHKRPLASKQGSITAMQTTDLGSMVVCEDTDLLFEEQPAAYKEITDIIHDLTPFVKVVAILRPIATYKMRNEKNRSS